MLYVVVWHVYVVVHVYLIWCGCVSFDLVVFEWVLCVGLVLVRLVSCPMSCSVCVLCCCCVLCCVCLGVIVCVVGVWCCVWL